MHQHLHGSQYASMWNSAVTHSVTVCTSCRCSDNRSALLRRLAAVCLCGFTSRCGWGLNENLRLQLGAFIAGFHRFINTCGHIGTFITLEKKVGRSEEETAAEGVCYTCIAGTSRWMENTDSRPSWGQSRIYWKYTEWRMARRMKEISELRPQQSVCWCQVEICTPAEFYMHLGRERTPL